MIGKLPICRPSRFLKPGRSNSQRYQNKPDALSPHFYRSHAPAWELCNSSDAARGNEKKTFAVGRAMRALASTRRAWHTLRMG